MSNDIINSGEETTKSKNETIKKNKYDNKRVNILEITVDVLFALFLIIGIGVFIKVLYGGGISFGGINLDERDGQLLPFVIITTSIVAGSFFIIKTYIRSEIGIKEVEMGKYFMQAIEKFNEKQDKKFKQYSTKFDKQLAKLDKRFTESKQLLTGLDQQYQNLGKMVKDVSDLVDKVNPTRDQKEDS